MLDRLGVIKLDEAGAGNRMDRIASRIGNQVKMKPSQRHPSLTTTFYCSPCGRIGAKREQPQAFPRAPFSIPAPDVFARPLSTAIGPFSAYPAAREIPGRDACFPDFIRDTPASKHQIPLPIVAL
jgi:hypothetical protein